MIIERLRQEHRNISKLLAVLDRELAVLEAGKHPDYEVIRSIISYFEVHTAIYHHPQEDLVYSRLKIRDPATASRIGSLAEAHREGTHRLRSFAEAIDFTLSDGGVLRQDVDAIVRDFIAQERQHMAMEEQEFFPAACEALEPGDWDDIAAALDSRRDPVFSDATETRFSQVREYIWRLEDEAEAERRGRRSLRGRRAP